MIKRKRKESEFIRRQPKKKNGAAFAFIHKFAPFFIIFVSLIIANQKNARELNYNTDILGYPSFMFRGEPIFPIYSIFIAWVRCASNFYREAGTIIYRNINIILYSSIIAFFVYLLLVYIRNVMTDDKNQMNTGRLGYDSELKGLGLKASCGVVIGQSYNAETEVSWENGGLKLTVKKTGDLIMYNTNVSGMLFAGSRLGKGISTVITTLIMFPYSLITLDPKGENYNITAGWRAKFSHVIKWNPTSRDTLKINILDEIDKDFPFRDANTIAQILTAPTTNSNADPHWQQTAKVLITATILHVKCSNKFQNKDKNLPQVYKYLSQGCDSKTGKGNEDKIKRLLQAMIDEVHTTPEIHQSIVSYASQILSAADEERGSIFSSALESLSVFNDTIVAESVETSDFCLDDFKISERPISWYMTIPFPDLDRLAPLLRLMIEFVCRKFSQEGTQHGKESLKNRILFLIDEFPTIGKCEAVETFAGILNGYGISFLWIAQTKAQLDKVYGDHTALYEHARYIWIYSINDHNVAEYFSKRIGSEGFIKQNTSSSGNKFELGMSNMTISNDITERPLITATELENLAGDTLVLMIQGQPSHLLKKVAYYSDPRFMDKVNLPVPQTREELLKEVETSCVIGVDEERWENKIIYDEKEEELMRDEEFFPDYDPIDLANKNKTNSESYENKLTAKEKLLANI